MSYLALPLLIMLMACYIEVWSLQRWRAQRIPWDDVVLNLNSGHIVLWLFRGFEIIAYAWVLRNASIHWVEHWPRLIQWVFAFVAWDFCFYWMHRLHHQFGLLWAVHELHHEGEYFNLSLGVRNSWYSSLTNFPFVAGLAVLGVPVTVFVAVSAIHYSIQLYNHNAWTRGTGLNWLNKLLVTPDYHRVHHGANRIYRDKNFAGTFRCWDDWFGTYQAELSSEPIRYGVVKPLLTHNPFWINHIPLLRYFGVHNNSGFKIPPKPFTPLWLARAGFVLFAVVVFYVWTESLWTTVSSIGGTLYARWWFAATIAIGTIVLGAAADGRAWGIWGWFVVVLVLLWFLFYPAMVLDTAHPEIKILRHVLMTLLFFQFAESVLVGWRVLRSDN